MEMLGCSNEIAHQPWALPPTPLMRFQSLPLDVSLLFVWELPPEQYSYMLLVGDIIPFSWDLMVICGALMVIQVAR
jgi:hypothetical protein